MKYGPFDKYDLEKSHMFGANLTKVLNNDTGVINVWCNGGEKRDLLYVNDFCEFVYKAINKQKNNYSLFNVGYGQALSVKEIISMIIKLSNKNIALKFDTSMPSIKTSLSLNCSKANKELSWYPKTKLSDGIKKSILWYKDNILND